MTEPVVMAVCGRRPAVRKEVFAECAGAKARVISPANFPGPEGPIRLVRLCGLAQGRLQAFSVVLLRSTRAVVRLGFRGAACGNLRGGSTAGNAGPFDSRRKCWLRANNGLHHGVHCRETVAVNRLRGAFCTSKPRMSAQAESCRLRCSLPHVQRASSTGSSVLP